MVFYAKGREASDNLYTVYTAHPFRSRPSLPPARLPPLSASYQNIRRLPPHVPKERNSKMRKKKKKKKNQTKRKKELLCFMRQLPDRGNKTLQNKINRNKMVYILVCTISVINLKTIFDFDIFSETTGPKYNSLFGLSEESKCLCRTFRNIFSCRYSDKQSTIIKMNLYRKIKLNLIHYLNLLTISV